MTSADCLICDAGPLIILGKTGHLPMLASLCPRVCLGDKEARRGEGNRLAQGGRGGGGPEAHAASGNAGPAGFPPTLRAGAEQGLGGVGREGQGLPGPAPSPPPYPSPAALPATRLFISKTHPNLWIPRAVWNEVVNEGAGRPPSQWLHDNFRNAIKDGTPELVTAFGLQVDQGEAEALAIAIQTPGATLLMDDARGRTVAKAAGLKTIGTLGILILARRSGHLANLKPAIQELKNAGWYISDKWVEAALNAVGE